MRRCPRHGNDSVEVIQTIDNSLCYGPCDVHVACDAFNSATILSIKSNMIVMDVALDSMGQASSLKPSSATFVINLEDIIEIRSFCLSESGPALTDEEMEEGIVLLLNNGKGN